MTVNDYTMSNVNWSKEFADADDQQLTGPSRFWDFEMKLREILLQNAEEQRTALQNKSQALETKMESLSIEVTEMKTMLSKILEGQNNGKSGETGNGDVSNRLNFDSSNNDNNSNSDLSKNFTDQAKQNGTISFRDTSDVPREKDVTRIFTDQAMENGTISFTDPSFKANENIPEKHQTDGVVNTDNMNCKFMMNI